MDDRVPELVSDLQDQVAAQIKAAFPSIAPEKARDVGLRVADYITTNWGGQLIYIPKNVYVSLKNIKQYSDKGCFLKINFYKFFFPKEIVYYLYKFCKYDANNKYDLLVL